MRKKAWFEKITWETAQDEGLTIDVVDCWDRPAPNPKAPIPRPKQLELDKIIT
jgi:hypothetical protein